MTTITRTQFLPRPREEVFAFFADPRNLEAITPPWLHFRITDLPDGPLTPGATIDYRLRLHGIPIRWRTLISSFDPPYRFVDEQIRGPYREWIHTHTFDEIDGGTRVRDDVTFRVPGGKVIERLFVRRDVTRIFDYRAEVLEKMFAATAESSTPAA